MGYSPDKALQEYERSSNVLDIAYLHILKGIVTKSSIDGIYKGDRLEKALSKAFCSIPLGYFLTNQLGIVSTDISTGRQIIFTSDPEIDMKKINDDNVKHLCSPDIDLSFAVAASCSLPGVFLPKEMESEGLKLADGGLTNNLPSDVARALGADKVISIDLGYAGMTKATTGIYSILKTSMEIMMERVVDINKDEYGIYLNPQIFDVTVLEFDRADECFARGYAYGKKVAPAISAYIEGDARWETLKTVLSVY
ncbi:NTE family protein RssA [compost metagenome]